MYLEKIVHNVYKVLVQTDSDYDEPNYSITESRNVTYDGSRVLGAEDLGFLMEKEICTDEDYENSPQKEMTTTSLIQR